MTDDLEALAGDYQSFCERENPVWAHLSGRYASAGSYTDISRAAEDARIVAARAFADRASSIDPAGLDAEQRLTRTMIGWDAASTAERTALRTADFGADPVFGAQASLGTHISRFPLPTREVAEAMVDKLASVATYFTDLAERHGDGVASGRTPAARAVVDTIDQLDGWLASPLSEDRLLDIAPTPADVDRAELLGRLRDVVSERVRPALATYRDVLRDAVLPHARPDDRVGLLHVPDGAAAYETLARFYTTTDLTPQEIHEIGLRQVAALHEEYAELGPDVVGTDHVPSILAALRDDPALHHTDGAGVVDAAKAAMEKARAVMGEWFGRLPQADCEVEATTSGAVAYYIRPALDGSRGGAFFMNVTDPTGWGRYDVESTAYHEGIPGHHLQLAIAQELEGLPDVRRTAHVTAYIEGWGLYAERLADEMGLYASATDRMGMLTADSMRACRLVVDTGMHALGWSRQRAIDYMLANTARSVGHATAEIDRYVVMPGQALAYMIGRLEILRIREAAQRRLGDRFDIADFHDVVLGSGALPLTLLAEHVEARLP
ncbi:MAG: DUF885 domain-containing protein [Nocardioidaceae bacterium]|nr:DUF885 domain-containing protein [Nocardioidaceae bacterium]MCL2612955.1 DUF885 domain-containing protein [Nocardioidaceae bacterium]